jgi:FimV-like protein
MTQAQRNASSLFQRSALWAALSLSIFGSAQALTLNRPVVQSKQGEALRAEIDISEITISEQVEFQASLASQDIYRAAKIEPPVSNGVPVDIQVQLLRRDNGKPYLKITSKQPIYGNSLDLLIDLRWATGSMLRDINVSLDESSASKKTSSSPLPGITTSNASSAKVKEKSAADQTTTGQIVVKRGDTASELAVGKTPAGVSLEQMLVALLRSNPDAFVDANVNRMKAGALLTLPTEQEAKAISRDEARREIQIQTKDFEAYRAELAARAPGGAVPKVAKDASGRLDAKVQNNNAKANQDKLTLTKPGSKDAAADKIAQQREAEEVANRAAELSRNIAELGKIAAATAGGAASPASDAASAGGVLSIDVPASAAEANGEWLNELRDNTLTPVGAGSLIGLLVLIALWRRRSLSKSEDDIQGLPPLNVKFNLDLPDHDSHEPVERAYIHDVTTHMNEGHEHPHDHADEDYHYEEPSLDQELPTRPTMEMPNISLDLDEPDTPTSPYQVRIDLANELWNLGQLHTSKALMEEVANEAAGADKEKALQWLAERA